MAFIWWNLYRKLHSFSESQRFWTQPTCSKTTHFLQRYILLYNKSHEDQGDINRLYLLPYIHNLEKNEKDIVKRQEVLNTWAQWKDKMFSGFCILMLTLRVWFFFFFARTFTQDSGQLYFWCFPRRQSSGNQKGR